LCFSFPVENWDSCVFSFMEFCVFIAFL
jgi:hypothetical protein